MSDILTDVQMWEGGGSVKEREGWDDWGQDERQGYVS